MKRTQRKSSIVRNLLVPCLLITVLGIMMLIPTTNSAQPIGPPSTLLNPIGENYSAPPEWPNGMTEEEYVKIWAEWNKTQPKKSDFVLHDGSQSENGRAITFCNNCNSCSSNSPSSNPNVVAQCQQTLNLVFVIDESASIDNSEAALVESGVIAFLDELSCTNINIAVIEFGYVANYVVNQYSSVSSIQTGMQNYFDGNATNSGPFTGQTYRDGTYGTNWHSAFLLANNLAVTPDLILFFTDGVPTIYTDDPSSPSTAWSSCGNPGSTQIPEIFNPIEVSNELKSKGAHVFVLGVGVGNSSTAVSNIQSISGPTLFNASGSGDATNIATADYSLTTNFSQMQTSLENFARNLCPLIVTCDATPVCTNTATGGTLTVDFANDAIAPFTVSLNGGTSFTTSSDPYVFTNLPAGSYTVTATDSSVCTRATSCSSTITTTNILLSETNIDNFCNGGNFGSIDLTVAGGVIPYIYNWSNGGSTQDITDLTAGLYSVTVTDSNGCEATLADIEISQPNPSTGEAPCECAQRWEEGGHWNVDGTINDAGNAPDPKGIIRCGNAADTQSGIESNGCTYDSNAFVIDLTNAACFSPNTGLPANVTPPVQGCPISWLNFDARANAGSYSYQIVSNDNIGWALYYSNTHTNGLNGNGLSGSATCSDLVYWACGDGFNNTWATFTVPSFAQATNLYLAIWDLDCTDPCTYDNDLSYNFKARQGCGDGEVLCNLETLPDSSYCNPNGTYTVEIPIIGANGDYQGYDPNATPTTSSVVTLGNLGTGGPISGTIVMTYPVTVTSYNIIISEGAGSTDPDNSSACADTVSGVAPSCCDLEITNVSDSPINCHDGSNGTITITATSTITPIEYSIDNGVTFQSGNTFNGLSSGSTT
ncbi:MAG: VWA domain-containing protein [Chitinophagales bacterium]